MKMKFSFLWLILFFFATAHSYLYTIPDVIYDTSGNKLHRGIPYYIVPLLHGSGGVLMLSRNSKEECLLNVTQEPFEVSEGIPFTFNPVSLEETLLVRASYPTSIEAVVVNPCSGSNKWKVSTATKSDEDVAAGSEFVTTGGELNTPESCFQIVEVKVMPELLSYQIQHCPLKCGSSSSMSSVNCYNVGVSSDAKGKRYLGPTNALYPVVFVSSFGKHMTQSAKSMK